MGQEKQTLYLVDYDIAANAPNRRKFYRARAKLLTKLGVEESSKSVIVAEDRETAEAVYDLASLYAGCCRLYEAHILLEKRAP